MMIFESPTHVAHSFARQRFSRFELFCHPAGVDIWASALDDASQTSFGVRKLPKLESSIKADFFF